jgi:glycosyltransferase involved in cell wall biosynthesis
MRLRSGTGKNTRTSGETDRNIGLVHCGMPYITRKDRQQRKRMTLRPGCRHRQLNRKASSAFIRNAPMDIQIVTNAVAGGWSPRDLGKFLGGSEEAVTLCAEALARKGHTITVYASLNGNMPEGDNLNGVSWRPRAAYEQARPCDVLVGFKDRSLWLFPHRARVAIHWSSDVEPPLKPAALARVDRVIALSSFHAERLAWAGPKLCLIPHGIGFQGAPGVPWAERESVALACSSPDRGLERLLQDWPRIRQGRPDLGLVVAYGIERFPATPWLTRMQHLLRQPGITYLGAIDARALTEWMRRARYWIHSLNQPEAELFCIGAVKAQALGAMPVIYAGQPSGLSDTVKSYIPYRDFIAGSDRAIGNPVARMDLPLTWDEVVTQYWEPLMRQHPTPSCRAEQAHAEQRPIKDQLHSTGRVA